ncbi:hypothetical protein LEN26_009979 [Aphanomyces euteiches]|nr:hypothetical protein AeMF1_018249 [Aphanomyces euteiches]KAH9123351.1 hypothetical protein LEN26_009979 [Aphanomyces euteiches]KAH9193171.1 hypothetical protein AeNC1_004846 [Aphanomyces euteiches]
MRRAVTVAALLFAAASSMISALQAIEIPRPVAWRALEQKPPVVQSNVEQLAVVLDNLAHLSTSAEQDKAIDAARSVFSHVDKDKLLVLLKDVPSDVKDKIIVASIATTANSTDSNAPQGHLHSGFGAYAASCMMVGAVVLVLFVAFRWVSPYASLASDQAIIAHVLDKLQEDDTAKAKAPPLATPVATLSSSPSSTSKAAPLEVVV